MINKETIDYIRTALEYYARSGLAATPLDVDVEDALDALESFAMDYEEWADTLMDGLDDEDDFK